MSARLLAVSLILAAVFCGQATAQATRPAGLRIAIDSTLEENKKQIRATVTLDDKPLANATVAFYVKRTFGNLLLGQDATDEDGTAEVAFPADLPGGMTGELAVLATLTSPAQYVAGRGEATLSGAKVVSVEALAYPRALWAPRAPVLLIAAIFAILLIVWCVYAYVVIQLVRIARS